MRHPVHGQDEGGGGQKMSVFVHAQVIKTVHAGEGGGQKMAKFCPRSCRMIPMQEAWI